MDRQEIDELLGIYISKVSLRKPVTKLYTKLFLNAHEIITRIYEYDELYQKEIRVLTKLVNLLTETPRIMISSEKHNNYVEINIDTNIDVLTSQIFTIHVSLNERIDSTTNGVINISNSKSIERSQFREVENALIHKLEYYMASDEIEIFVSKDHLYINQIPIYLTEINRTILGKEICIISNYF